MWTYAYNSNLALPLTANVVMVSPAGAITTTTYDGQGNIQSVLTARRVIPRLLPTTRSAFCRSARQYLPEPYRASRTTSASGCPLVQVDALNNRTSMQYDVYGNLDNAYRG